MSLRWLRRMHWSLFAAGLFLAIAPAQQAQPAPKAVNVSGSVPAKTSDDAKSAQAADYVGAETCKACHEDEYNSWEKSPHWKTTLDTKGGPAHQGCEGCHGPGSEHVAGGGDVTKIFTFQKVSAKVINERCMTCHEGGTQHMNAINSVHAKNDVSCIACHSPHHATQPQFLLVKAQPELCYGCHLAQKPAFEMPFHHRVNERLVRCSDCHNPHGTAEAKQVRTSAAQDVVCFTCHADKRGPFVYEHEPIKVEGCQTCHTPHGSPNAHMLKTSNVNQLCLSCHTSSFANAPGAPSFHNQAAQYQACTLCHVQIHGSNVDHWYFR